MDNTTQKPIGRTLTEFKPLNPAELKLLEACRVGEKANISEQRPEPGPANIDKIVRASFLRFLALGGDEYAPIHENGVLLQGAWVEDDLNLVSAFLPHSLGLINCHLNTITLRYSKVHGFLGFQGCYVRSLDGDCIVQ